MSKQYGSQSYRESSGNRKSELSKKVQQIGKRPPQSQYNSQDKGYKTIVETRENNFMDGDANSAAFF